MAVEVTVGGKPATNVTRASDHEITFTTPMGTKGPVMVVVTIDGEASLPAEYTFD